MGKHSREPQAAHDPVADDIDNRDAATGDTVAGEQVLDEGKVSPNHDEIGDDHDESASRGREHAAAERTDAGAAPIQPEAS